jgi:hypothetical protein
VRLLGATTVPGAAQRRALGAGSALRSIFPLVSGNSTSRWK